MNEMKQLCQQYDIHPDAAAFLVDAYGKLLENPEAYAVFQQQVEVYRKNYLFDHKPVLEKLHALEASVGVSWMTIDILYMLKLLPILQELYRKENIDELRRQLNVTQLHFVATDGYTNHIRDTVDAMDDKTYEVFLNYHFATCERPDMIGYSHHTIDVFRKDV